MEHIQIPVRNTYLTGPCSIGPCSITSGYHEITASMFASLVTWQVQIDPRNWDIDGKSSVFWWFGAWLFALLIYIYTYIRYMINLNDNIRYIHINIFIHIFITFLRIHCLCTHTFHPLHTSARVPSSFPVKRCSRIPTKSFSRRIFATRRTQNRWCWLPSLKLT